MSLVADYSDSDETSDGSGEVEYLQKLKSSEVKGANETSSKTGATSNNNNVANFLGTASDSSDSESDEEIPKTKEPIKLDNPFRTFGDVNVAKEDSVFRNPFRDKEEEKIAVLERHVKMTENPATVLTINGKKICWNYRKRKCYLGSKCPYAHDSDIILTEEQLKEQKQETDLHRASAGGNTNSVGLGVATGKSHLPGTASVVEGGYDSSAFYSSPHLGKRNHDLDLEDRDEDGSSKSKMKRVGLSNNLQPPHKAMQLYQKTKDRRF